MKTKVPDIPVLHGWRATSILLVLICHWVPLPPKSFQLNDAFGAAGMALFFSLSGFLIVTFLDDEEPISLFLIKRVARIVPLAWFLMIVLFIWHSYPVATIVGNLLFLNNLPPSSLIIGGHHLWSLSVEMQFYAIAALLCLALGRSRGLITIPFLCVLVTAARLYSHEYISIVTWHRIDEIFSGGTLALIYRGRIARDRWLERLPFLPLALAFALSCAPSTAWFQLFRPYFAAALIGSTLRTPPWLIKDILTSRAMRFIAEISYAVYVIHGFLTETWFGAQPGKYLKRPLILALTFFLAYASTRFVERPLNRWARLWGDHLHRVGGRMRSDMAPPGKHGF